jgi:hypothetical protein
MQPDYGGAIDLGEALPVWGKEERTFVPPGSPPALLVYALWLTAFHDALFVTPPALANI